MKEGVRVAIMDLLLNTEKEAKLEFERKKIEEIQKQA
jgi:hypothetical protein